MKEEIAQIVNNMVSTFKGSSRAKLWYAFTDTVREDMIDACVMDQVRSAVWKRVSLQIGSMSSLPSHSEANAFTMRDLMDIRRAFIRALHEGIPQRGKPHLQYVLEANKKEGPL